MSNTGWLKGETEAIEARRKKCKQDFKDESPDDTEPGLWGLALSGGGIRSATFCLGVVKSLAANGVLRRFDYLSTVSGGGYAGAAIGRLFQAVGNAGEVQTGLAKDDKLFWWWLRKNGRYLFPAGAKDALFAGSTLARNLAAIHFELFLIGVLLSCIIIVPHLFGMGMGYDFQQLTSWSRSAWWLFATILPLLFFTCTWAYWFSNTQRRLRIHPSSLIFAAVGIVVSAMIYWPGLMHLLIFGQPSAQTCQDTLIDINPIRYATWAVKCLSPASRFVLLQLSLSIPFGVLVAWLAGVWPHMSGPIDTLRARNRLTRLLMYVLYVAIAISVFAVLDMFSWWIAGTVVRGWTAFAAGGGGLFIIIVVGRALLLWLKTLQPRAGTVNVIRIANIAGLILGFLFLLFCATFVQVIVFYGGGFLTGTPPVNEPEIWATQSWARLALLVIPCLTYVLVSGRNIAALNDSSLHNFYRARLTRSYVSVGNKQRGFDPNALAQATPAATDSLIQVSNISAGDDASLSKYHPHEQGGPLHLINVCVNQTVNDRTREFNRDRKGRNMTVSSLGCDLGSVPQHCELNLDHDGLTLGQWIAISGAAATPGMGANTSKGLAALFTLCGIRTGYWLNIGGLLAKSLKGVPVLRKALPKYAHLMDEVFATFPGSNDPHWYVSDGGHFENTGVYALLKREVKVIVAVDCGADSNYAYEDLNNLVRLARIDFGTEIIFQKPDYERAKELECDVSAFGTLAEIASTDSSAFLAMARITYASGDDGHLIIIKPTTIATLPLDLANYKRGNPNFPQQTTGDQSFDEAQWESYFRLGEELGRTVNKSLLEKLPDVIRCFSDHLGTGMVVSESSRVKAVGRGQPKFAGEVVKSSLGVGAVFGLLFSVWQMWDQQRGTTVNEQRQYTEAINKAIEKSVDSDGNLRVSDAGILFLEGIIKPGESVRTDLDLTRAQSLIDRLSASCQKEGGVADDEHFAFQCQQLARLAQPFARQGGTMMTAYWPDWSKGGEQKSSDATMKVAGVSSSADQKVSAPDASLVPLPATPSVARAPVDLAEVKETQAKKPASPESPKTSPVLADKPGSAVQSFIQPLKTACLRADGSKARLYIQVYGEREFSALSAAAKGQLGIALTGVMTLAAIENVDATAKKLGTRPPYRWSAPTLIYHNESERACAENMANVYERFYGLKKPNVRSLPARLKKQPGAIELWVPIGGAPKVTGPVSVLPQ